MLSYRHLIAALQKALVDKEQVPFSVYCFTFFKNIDPTAIAGRVLRIIMPIVVRLR